MLKLLGKPDCPICEQSKSLLNRYNVEYEFLNITLPENFDIPRKFKIKVAGKFLYDDQKDEVISVSEYIDNLG